MEDMTNQTPPDAGSGEKKARPRVRFRSIRTADQEAYPKQIIVVCRQPGLRRGGRAHSAITVYPPDVLSESDLILMENEPLLEVIEVL